MRSLDVLIAHWSRRAKECSEEIDALVRRYNEGYHDAKARNSTFVDADLKHMCAGWNDERQVARDTVSWLRTIHARQGPSHILKGSP